MDADFLTIASPGEAETRVRGSRFLAYAYPADGEEAARFTLLERARRYFDASHHCAAWRFRDGVWRAIDAGEPNGSAGAPILAAIDGAGLVDLAVVVTRWFGGTKLGVGGLVRAYGDAAAAALELTPRRRGTVAERLIVSYDYAHTSAIMRAIERLDAAEVEHGYADAGSRAETSFSLPAARVAELHEILREHTAGAVQARSVAATVLYLP